MLKYAKIINEETKLCEVGLGTNTTFYKSIGMIEMDVEQAYDGCWYLKGYAPEKSQEEKEQELQEQVRSYRKYLLSTTDYTQLNDAPFTEGEKTGYAEYRQYLRNYTKSENWWLQNPMTYEEWLVSQHPVNNEE